MITFSESQQKIVDALEAANKKEINEVLEQIRDEIKQMDTLITRSEVLEVIDKYLD